MKTESLQATEKLGAEGATHERITLDWMISQIDQWHCFTLDEVFDNMAFKEVGGDSALLPVGWAKEASDKAGHVVLCLMILRSGFVVIGKSAPMSKENRDFDKSRTFAYEDCIRQLWPLFAFARLQNAVPKEH